MEQKVTVDIGGGFCGLLTIAFIVLKLMGYISWSWIWVLSPLWIPVTLGLALFIILLIIKGITSKRY